MFEEINAEPFRIKVVEPIKLISRDEREKKLSQAHYNVTSLKAEDVYIDLCSDSGTSAMSDRQWSAMMMGDESYAGCRSFFNFEKAVQDIFGYKYVVPTHQGRPAESFLFKTLIKEGDIVPFNMPFDSTGAHIRVNGAEAVECVYDHAYEPTAVHPFKGNIDINRLESLIDTVGIEKIPFIMLTLTNNHGGGQPVSMANIKAVRKIADKYGILLCIDAARCAENAYFIKQREAGYERKSLPEITKEQFKYADACTCSAKKDPLVNMGGFIATNDRALYDKILPLLILNEGFVTYGGMSGRDLEALARGLYEMVEEDYMSYRVRQTEYLGRCLEEIGIDIVKPVGGSGVYIDAQALFPSIPQSQLPADTLSMELYRECGVRGAGLGALAFAREDPETKQTIFPKMEVMRLAIPRRVYTHRHLDFVAEGLRCVYKRRQQVKGLRIVWAPAQLRHFLAHLAPVG